MSVFADPKTLFELVRKYNRPGPRYTSYPPAPHFTDEFGRDDFGAALKRSGENVSGLSVYVHLPFCRSLCYYCGCHMVVTGRRDRIAEYLRYLKKEIDLIAAHLAASKEVVQLHWGGGTPTYLTPSQISDLMAHLYRRFDFTSDAELSLEGDPRGLTPAHLQAARESGFTRLSVGVQDFDARVQKAINREQSVEMVRSVTQTARQLGYVGVNYDLVYGLPHQSVASFLKTVDQVLRLDPDRISLFSYAHVPWKKKHQSVIHDDWLPTSEEKIRIFVEAQRMLTSEGGYRYVGMDHFVRPSDPLVAALEEGTLQRNFQGYSTHAGTDLVGFGVSAISRLGQAYAQNVLDLRDYSALLDTDSLTTVRGYRMTEDDLLRSEIIAALMCRLHIEVGAVEEKYGIDFWTYFSDALGDLDEMESDGLVNLSPEAVEVTETGRLFIRNVAMAFDANLKAGRAVRARYSETV